MYASGAKKKHTAEIATYRGDCNIPRRLQHTAEIATYRRDYLLGVHHTTEMISVHTTKTILTVCNTLRR